MQDSMGIEQEYIHVVDNNTLNPHRWGCLRGCLRPGSMWGRLATSAVPSPPLLLRPLLTLYCVLPREQCARRCDMGSGSAIEEFTDGLAKVSVLRSAMRSGSRSWLLLCARTASARFSEVQHAGRDGGGGIGCSGSGALARRPARRWEDLVHADPLAGSPSPFALIRCAVAPLTTV